MYGAILGDMIGSPYEFDRGNKTKDFPLFIPSSTYTDDTIMSIAIADALMYIDLKDETEIKNKVIKSMQYWGRKYPYAGYGGMFSRWLHEDNPKPYGSFGNGSAMRVSSIGWLYSSLDETEYIAKISAEVTHNHIEGIKGAQSVAGIIYLARNGADKADITDYVTGKYNYTLNRTCDEIRPTYHHVETCQGTVPEAITAFLEGNNFEDVIRNAVSLGGDCDTLTCIAGSMAEAFYGIPDNLIVECRSRLDNELLTVVDQFVKRRNEND